MFPTIDIEENLTSDETSNNSFGKTYLFDFDQGEFVLKDGKLVIASELEAIKQWVTKIIRTEKFKFKIYEKEVEEKNKEYGITFRNLLGKKLPKEMIRSEIKRELTDVLTKHPKIKTLSEFKIIQEGVKVTINFKVHLVNGSIISEVVV